MSKACVYTNHDSHYHCANDAVCTQAGGLTATERGAVNRLLNGSHGCFLASQVQLVRAAIQRLDEDAQAYHRYITTGKL